MLRIPRFLVLGVGLLVLATLGLPLLSQEPTKASPTVEAYVTRIMAFDKNNDGKVTREEVTDERLVRLFDRADSKKRGFITREDIVALATQEAAIGGQPGDGKGGKDGKGGDKDGGKGGKDGDKGGKDGMKDGKDGKDGMKDGKGGKDGMKDGKDGFGKDKGGFGKDGFKDGFGKDKGGFGKDGGFGKGFGRPQPGVLMPAFLQDVLKMTDDQKKQVEKLQTEVDGKLEKILTDEQRKQLKEMKEGGLPPRP